MIVDYESTQTVEISTADGYFEAKIVIGLEQLTLGYPASFDPQFGGDPGAGPEWDISTVAFIDDDGKSREFGPLMAMIDIAMTIFGRELWDNMVEAAFVDATENYENNGGYDG